MSRSNSDWWFPALCRTRALFSRYQAFPRLSGPRLRRWYEHLHILHSRIFTALQLCRRGIVMRKMSVCLSVRPSVKRVNCDKTKETYAHILIPQERSMHLVLRRIVGGGCLLLPEILDQSDSPSKTAISDLYSFVVPQPSHLAKKINEIIGSPLSASQ